MRKFFEKTLDFWLWLWYNNDSEREVIQMLEVSKFKLSPSWVAKGKYLDFYSRENSISIISSNKQTIAHIQIEDIDPLIQELQELKNILQNT